MQLCRILQVFLTGAMISQEFLLRFIEFMGRLQYVYPLLSSNCFPISSFLSKQIDDILGWCLLRKILSSVTESCRCLTTENNEVLSNKFLRYCFYFLNLPHIEMDESSVKGCMDFPVFPVPVTWKWL